MSEFSTKVVSQIINKQPTAPLPTGRPYPAHRDATQRAEHMIDQRSKDIYQYVGKRHLQKARRWKEAQLQCQGTESCGSHIWRVKWAHELEAPRALTTSAHERQRSSAHERSRTKISAHELDRMRPFQIFPTKSKKLHKAHMWATHERRPLERSSAHERSWALITSARRRSRNCK